VTVLDVVRANILEKESIDAGDCIATSVSPPAPVREYCLASSAKSGGSAGGTESSVTTTLIPPARPPPPPLAADADELALRLGEPKEAFRLNDGLRPSRERSLSRPFWRTLGCCLLSGDWVMLALLVLLLLPGLKKEEKKGASFWVGVRIAPFFCMMMGVSIILKMLPSEWDANQ
jgi:hypothetical protein